MTTEIMQEWRAKEYHENSEVQQEAAMYLLKLLKIKGQESILDVGCGDGKITAFIAKELTQGIVCGTDSSSEMVEFAMNQFLPSKRKNLDFLVQNAEEICHSIKFDIVFSSFVIQWVKNARSFFDSAWKNLTKEGVLACTIPLSISDPLEDALAFLISQAKWAFYFEGFELNYYLRNGNIYRQLLLESHFIPTHFEIVEQKWVFSCREDFELYTLMWLPHLQVLPKNLRLNFFNQLIDKYVEINPCFQDGSLSFDFTRVDFIAKKKN